jgi:hypothetical protein
VTEDLSNLFPVRACEFEESADGLIVALYRKAQHNFLEKILFKSMLDKPQKIDLDEIGSFIWKLCDGNKSMQQIVEQAKIKFSERIEPAVQRVKLFVDKMHSMKLINLYKKQLSGTVSQ